MRVLPFRSAPVTLCARVRWHVMDVLRVPGALSSRLPGRLGESASGAVVSLVRLHGVISPQPSPVPRSVINAANLEKVLERAFAPAGLAAVALLVNSPGGSATQSALVGGPDPRSGRRARRAGARVLRGRRRLRRVLAGLRRRRDLRPPDVARRVDRGDQPGLRAGRPDRAVRHQRRLYTAGGSKSRLDPFLPEKAEDVAWLRGLQDQLHASSPSGCASAAATG